jgi:hypothetical protein
VIGRREAWAVFSPGRNWRYRLVRVWDSNRTTASLGDPQRL